MKFFSRIIVLILGVFSWALVIDAQGANILPPLPADEFALTRVIFPNEHIQSSISEAVTSQSFLFPVSAGDMVQISVRRIDGELVPFLRLKTTAGGILAEQEASNLAGNRATIQYTAQASAWYVADVMYDPASVSYGSFDLSLTGATGALYQLLAAGQPPEGVTDAVYLTRGSALSLNVSGDAVYLIALNAGEVLRAKVNPSAGIDLTLQAVPGDALEPPPDVHDGVLMYTNDRPRWTILTVSTGQRQQLSLDIAITRVEQPGATLAAYRLADLITASPFPTNTATVTPSATSTFTLTPAPTRTPLATPTPITCPGALPSRLSVGETGRVTLGDNANRVRSGAGREYGEIDRIQPGEVFEVMSGPKCANNFAWYQVDYTRGIGWTAEADSQMYWLEPYDPDGPQLLTGGFGKTNRAPMGPGEFQVEYYCRNQGYGIKNDNNNWYCTSGNRIAYTLAQADFDTICQETYKRPDAFARQDGATNVPAYNWRCYGP